MRDLRAKVGLCTVWGRTAQPGVHGADCAQRTTQYDPLAVAAQARHWAVAGTALGRRRFPSLNPSQTPPISRSGSNPTTPGYKPPEVRAYVWEFTVAITFPVGSSMLLHAYRRMRAVLRCLLPRCGVSCAGVLPILRVPALTL